MRDAFKSIATLEAIHEKRGAYEDEDIRLYTINVHAMKSALANIGEPELSAAAFKLEQAGRDKNTAVMSAETGAFLNELRKVIGKLTPPKEKGVETETTDQDLAYLREKLRAFQKACSIYDKKAAKLAMTEIREKTWPPQTNELLGAISESLLSGDFEEAVAAAERIINQPS